MKISGHYLHNDDDTQVTYVPSPNVSGALEHKFLVMHFTAGRSAEESIQWLAKAQAKASAHLVIGRDGCITQLVPFNKVAWHAGASSWEGLQGLNKYSIGIELDNAGRLTQQGGQWKAWFGGTLQECDVVQAVHKHESKVCGWHAYTPEQIDSALHVAGLLMEQYGLIDVIGHEDIAPHRKCDPGPAFPMSNFRSRLMGRMEDETPLYMPTTVLNIRSGPGMEYQPLPGSPLQVGTKVRFGAAQGTWWWVEVQAGDGISNSFEGWVNSSYLQRV